MLKIRSPLEQFATFNIFKFENIIENILTNLTLNFLIIFFLLLKKTNIIQPFTIITYQLSYNTKKVYI